MFWKDKVHPDNFWKYESLTLIQIFQFMTAHIYMLIPT